MRSYTAFLMSTDDGRFEQFEADNDNLAHLIAEACCRGNEWVEEIREEPHGTAPDPHHGLRLLGADEVPGRPDVVTPAMRKQIGQVCIQADAIFTVMHMVSSTPTKENLLAMLDALGVEIEELKMKTREMPL